MNYQQVIKIVFAGALLALTITGCKNEAPKVASTSAPTGHGAEVMRTQCLKCHGDDLIQQQRLSKTGWTREVEKMVRWGAEVADADKEPLVEYLTASYGQRPFSKEPPPSPAPAADAPDAAAIARGKTLYEDKCRKCHQDDLVQQQRLSKTGWTREVEKMVRWGAEVNDDEKTALVEYLASQYNPTKK